MGEGLVKLGHVVWRTWTCGGVTHSFSTAVKPLSESKKPCQDCLMSSAQSFYGLCALVAILYTVTQQYLPIRELAIVMALSRQLGAMQNEDCFLSTFVHRTEFGPPRANQGVSKAEPRDGHAICTLQCTHLPPPVLPILLKQNLSPKTHSAKTKPISKNFCAKWRHKMKVSCQI